MFGRVISFIIGCMLLITSKQAISMELIAHKSIDSESISVSVARAIFSGRMKYWADGSPIRVIMLAKDSEEHIEFCKSILDIFPRQLQRSWDMIVFSGYGEGPLVAANKQEIISIVNRTKGAIGYIDEVSEDMGVQIVKIK